MNTRRVFIGVTLACVSANLFGQDKPVSALILTGPNAEVYDAPGKLPHGDVKRLAAQLPKPIYSLGGPPTYDMREVVEESGVVLSAKDVVLYSAYSRLLYARSSRDNITLIQTLFEMQDFTPSCCTTEFEIRRIDDVKTQQGTRVAAFRFPTVFGGTSEIAMDDSAAAKEKKMSFEVTVGSNLKTVEFTVSGEVPIREEEIALKLHSYGQIGVPITLYERAKTPSSGPGLLVTLTLGPLISGTPIQEWRNHKNEKIEKIEKELKDTGQ